VKTGLFLFEISGFALYAPEKPSAERSIAAPFILTGY
jgi:hypothetical protein